MSLDRLEPRSAIRRAAVALTVLSLWTQIQVNMVICESQYPPSLRVVLTFTVICALIAFVLRKAHIAMGAVVIVLITVLRTHCDFSGDILKVQGLPAAVLLTYVIVALFRGKGAAAEEEAWEACCGVAGAMYTATGINKLLSSGLGWVTDFSLAVYLASEALETPGWLGALREALSRCPPPLLMTANSLALAIELAGIAMVSRRLRPYYAAATALMHLGFYLGLGIGFWDWNILMLALVLCSPRTSPGLHGVTRPTA